MSADDYRERITALWPKPAESPTMELVELCQKAVAEHPESSELWYDLGIIMERCDDEYGFVREDFRRSFEKAIACDDANSEAYQELGFVLDVSFDDYHGAELAFKKAIELGASHECHYGRARVLAQMNKPDEALASISEQVCPFHNHPEINKLRSEIMSGLWGSEPPRKDGK